MHDIRVSLCEEAVSSTNAAESTLPAMLDGAERSKNFIMGVRRDRWYFEFRSTECSIIFPNKQVKAEIERRCTRVDEIRMNVVGEKI